jgi:hypothetical protein
MSNDIKLVQQGALARAACSSAEVNVARVYPDRGRAYPDEGRARPACPDEGRHERSGFRAPRVPTSSSGRPAAVNFSRPPCPQLAVRNVAQEPRILGSKPTRLNRQTPIYRTHRKSQKTKNRHSLKSPKNSNMEASDYRHFPTNFRTVSRRKFQECFASARSSMPSWPTGASFPPAAAAMARIAVWLLN